MVGRRDVCHPLCLSSTVTSGLMAVDIEPDCLMERLRVHYACLVALSAVGISQKQQRNGTRDGGVGQDLRPAGWRGVLTDEAVAPVAQQQPRARATFSRQSLFRRHGTGRHIARLGRLPQVVRSSSNRNKRAPWPTALAHRNWRRMNRPSRILRPGASRVTRSESSCSFPTREAAIAPQRRRWSR